MAEIKLSKRDLLIAGAGGIVSLLPGVARAAPERTLTAVLDTEVTILDPHVTTSNNTRNFGYQVWDTLFARDSSGNIQPQMVESHEVSDDKLRWQFKLRSGLLFHDGSAVTGADCVASLRRWMPLDSLGRLLLGAGATLTADANSFSIALTQPFPLMLSVLGKPNAPVPFILPAGIIASAGTGRIKDIIGSGPFSFSTEKWRPGDRIVLRRFADYRPRKEPADFLAGGKVVHIDELTLRAMPDESTAINALIAGEIDYLQNLSYDWVDKLMKTPNINVMALTKGIDMHQGYFRLNSASGPFADPDIRAVLWKLVDQHEMLEAAGIPARYRIDNCASFWMCGTPFSTDAGSSVARLDIAAAKTALARTSYKGEQIVILQVAGSIQTPPGSLLAQNMRQIGFNVDEQVMDWGTVLARRSKKQGWDLFPVYANGIDMSSPLTHFYIANNCSEYPGWSCSPTVTELLAKFAAAPDDSVRKSIAAQIQEEAYRTTPAVMWGQFARPTGYRSRVQQLIQSSIPIFWNVKLADA